MRGTICTLLVASLLLALVPNSGMAWAAERDLAILSSLGGDTGGDGDDGHGGGAVDDLAYSLRLIVGLGDGGRIRGGDVVLGECDGVVLLGFSSGAQLEEAMSWYSDPAHAAWADIDSSFVATEAGASAARESGTLGVGTSDNALALLAEAEEACGEEACSDDAREAVARAVVGALAAGGGPAEAEAVASRVASRRRLLGEDGMDAVLVALVDTGAPIPADGSADQPVLASYDVTPGDDVSETTAGAAGTADVVGHAQDRNGHATRVLASMSSENPDIRLVSIKALGDDGVGSLSSVYAAVELAVSLGADVVNLSLAGRAPDGSDAIGAAIAAAESAGVAVVAAAGNDGRDASGYVPASCADAFVVGAASADGEPLPSSNYGTAVDMWAVAPSTSLAAARVSGWLSAHGGSENGRASATGSSLAADWRTILTTSEVNARARVSSAGDDPVHAVEPTFDDGMLRAADGGEDDGDAATDTRDYETGVAYAALLDADNGTYAENTLLFLRVAADDAPEDGSATALVDICGQEWKVKGYWTGFEDASGYNDSNPSPWYEEVHAVASRVCVAPNQGIRPANSTAGWFRAFTAASTFDLEGIDASSVTGATAMFSGCGAVESIDISPLKLEKVGAINSMFNSCKGLVSIDLSSIDHGTISNMESMFGGCTALTSVKFPTCSLPKLGSLRWLFSGCSALQDPDIAHLDTSSATNMYAMFNGCKSLSSIDLSRFATTKVTNMAYMFQNCTSLTSLSVSSFATSKVTTMAGMFKGCSKLTSLSVSSFATSKVTDMHEMFSGCAQLSALDVSNFDLSQVTTIASMFAECAGLTSLVLPSDEPASGLPRLDTSRLTHMQAAFRGCSELSAIDVSGFDTSKVLNMAQLFHNCSKLESVDVSGFDTANVTDMSYMFYSCKELAALDVSGFVTSKVTTMACMFGYCGKLATLDVSGFDMGSATSIQQMFDTCSSLEQLDLSGWDTSNTSNMKNLFIRCVGLKSLDLGGRFDIGAAAAADQLPLISACSSLESVYLGAWADYNMGREASGRLQIRLPRSGTAGGARWWAADGGAYDGDTTLAPATHQQAQLLWGSAAPGVYARLSGSTLTIKVGAGRPNAEWYEEELGETAWVPDEGEGAGEGATKPLEGRPARPWEASRASITTVRFDGSGGKVRPTSMSCWFRGMGSITSVDLSGLDASLAGSLAHLFDGCSQLASLATSSLDPSGASDLSCLFRGCASLSSLDLSSWRVGKATDLSHAFEGCTSLASLDLSNLDTSGVVDMSGMLDGCSSLRVLDLGGSFSLASVQDASKVPSLPLLSSLEHAYLGAWAVWNADPEHSASQRAAVLPRDGETDAAWWDAEGGSNAGGATVVPGSLAQAQLSWGTAEPGVYARLEDGVLTFKVLSGEPDDGRGWRSVDNLGGWWSNNLANTRWDGSATHQPWADVRASVTKVVFDDSNGKVRPTGMGEWFTNLSKLAEAEFSGLDASQVTSFWSTFYGCQSLKSLDLTGLVASSATTLHTMFKGCSGLISINVSGWDTSQVTCMNQMFCGCTNFASIDLPGWDTGNVEDMSYMFDGCTSLVSTAIGNFDTAHVTSMKAMFQNCKAILTPNVAGFDMASATDVSYMFSGCDALVALDLSKWEGEQLTNMAYMLNACKHVSKLDLSRLDTSHVTDMTRMIYAMNNVTTINLGGKFSIERVGDGKLPALVQCYQHTSLDVGAWANYNKGRAAEERRPFTLATPSWNSGSGKTWWDGEGGTHHGGSTIVPMTSAQARLTWAIPNVYAGYDEETHILTFRNGGGVAPEGCYANNLTNTSGWPNNNKSQPWGSVRTSITGVSFDTSLGGTVRPQCMAQWFNGCTNLVRVDLSGLSSSASRSFRGMFSGCESLTDVDLSRLDTSSATSMRFMFQNCRALVSLDVSRLFVGKVTDMAYMFAGCGRLDGLELSRWDVSAVKDMASMLNGCASFTSLDLSGLDTSGVTDMTSMLVGCSSLTTLDFGGRFSIASVTSDEKLPTISGLDALTSVYLGAWATYNASHGGSERGVVLPNPSDAAEGTAWQDGEGVAHALGATFVPLRASQAQLLLGAEELGLYALYDSGTLTFKVSTGKPGDGWYDDNLLSTSDAGHAWSSAASQPWAQDRPSIARVVFDGSGGKARPLSMAWWFAGLSGATSFDLAWLDSSQAVSLSHLFDGCASLVSLDLSEFSTASATAMAGMFDGCEALSLVTLGPSFDFSGAGSQSPLTTLPEPEGEASALWCRVRDWQEVDAYDGTGLTATQLASAYDGADAMQIGTWEAQRLVAFGGNGGTGASARTVSLDALVDKALAAGLSRAYCGLSGWSALEPADDSADAGSPALPWDATVSDARKAAA